MGVRKAEVVRDNGHACVVCVGLPRAAPRIRDFAVVVVTEVLRFLTVVTVVAQPTSLFVAGVVIFRVTTGSANFGKESPMKMFAVAFAVAAVAALSGCPSNSAQACLKSEECKETEDPAAECTKQDEDCTKDADVCQKIRDACTAEQDELAACLVTNGKCEDKVFGAAAFGDECKDQAKAATDCGAKALE